MRKISFLLLVMIFFVACDNYEEQEFMSFVAYQIDEVIPIAKTQSSQAILLEEYSGWKCTNCPKAATNLSNN